jgi:replication factor C subunit 3/5
MYSNKENIPWVEKYRPEKFDEIVLEELNRKIFKNILEKKYFPNMIFYGPPGTGKTTTIINIIKEWQQKFQESRNGMVIHLNASDERGIDIIRNQIFQFVHSKNMFEKGIKFVILDEVDYMTKNAQQALKYLLQTSTQNVRFCLICNYISKVDESLKNELLSIRFNQLPKDEIDDFLLNVSNNENLNLSKSTIDTIQKMFVCDIRSMINFIQVNQGISDWDINTINDSVYDKIHELLFVKKVENKIVQDYLTNISYKYNIDKRNILTNYYNYIIYKKRGFFDSNILKNIGELIHNNITNMNQHLQFLQFNIS